MCLHYNYHYKHFNMNNVAGCCALFVSTNELNNTSVRGTVNPRKHEKEYVWYSLSNPDTSAV